MATATEAKSSEDLKCPSCGRTYPPNTNGPHFFAKHVATCKGPVATSGRIAAASANKVAPARHTRRADPPRAKASRKRSAMPRRKKRDYKAERERRKARGSDSSTSSEAKKQERMAGISPAAFLDALRAERAKIDAAIAAVEALA